MLMLLDTRGCRALVLLAGLLGATPAASQTEQPGSRVVQPRQQVQRRTSTDPGQIVPQLLKSLEFQQQALSIVTAADSEAQLKEAGRLLHEAYFYQRAAHSGIAKIERANKTPGSTAPQEFRLVEASRKNLLMARFRFNNAKPTGGTRLQSGLDFLRAAISQTQSVLAIHH